MSFDNTDETDIMLLATDSTFALRFFNSFLIIAISDISSRALYTPVKRYRKQKVEIVSLVSGSELLGKPVSEVLEWLFPLFDDLTQLLCKRDDVATVF